MFRNWARESRSISDANGIKLPLALALLFLSLPTNAIAEQFASLGLWANWSVCLGTEDA